MTRPKLDIAIDEYASPIKSSGTTGMSLQEMSKMLEDNGYRHLPILDNKKPVGMVSIRDLHLLKSLNTHFDLKAGDIMSANPYCVPRGTSIEDVAFYMSENKIGSAIIVDESGDAESIFTSIDGLNALVEIARGEY
ncbi:MAG: acetoin utilization protein AcuB [Bacteriovoracaceae bacterium]|jgi:acetoin utilization protein AcuB